MNTLQIHAESNNGRGRKHCSSWPLGLLVAAAGIACSVPPATATAPGPQFAWVPVEATGSYTITDNEIVLNGGGQQVTLELRLSGWGEADGNPELGTYQAQVDSSGYSSGSGDPLGPLGGCCPGKPAAAFVDANRPDYVFQGLLSIEAADVSLLNFRMGGTVLTPPCKVDGSASYYGGTLILDAPAGAAGTYTIGFANIDLETFWNDCSADPIPEHTLVPAVITVNTAVTGACCFDGECIGTMSASSCQAAGGTWFEGETCPGYSCPAPPLGACCYFDQCMETMPQTPCIVSFGTWYEGEECPEFDCPGDPFGACCVNGVCTGTMLGSDCSSEGGMWFEGEMCPGYACPGGPTEPQFRWIPVAATGSHAIVDGGIILGAGGQQVTLELRLAGWATAEGSPDLRTYQAQLDSSGLSSGSGDPLAPLGGCCPGDPAAAFVDIDHPDYVFQGSASVAAADVSQPNYRMGGTVLAPAPCAVDDGATHYGGTLIIDVPAGAAGTYTLGFANVDAETFLIACDGALIPQPAVFPTTITIQPTLPAIIELGTPSCVMANDCTGCWVGSECVAGRCYVSKNRYLSIDLTTNGELVAYQVDLTEAADYPTAIGRSWWVGEPHCYAFPDGSVDPTPDPPDCSGPDYFGWVAHLGPEPVDRVWTETPIHITGCGIVPAAGYEIMASADRGGTFSVPLKVRTARAPVGDNQSWGDVTGDPCSGQPGVWLAPDGATNLGDVGNAIRTFENRLDQTGFPPRVRVDVQADQVVNLSDVQFIVRAFEGTAYTDINLELIGTHPADCP